VVLVAAGAGAEFVEMLLELPTLHLDGGPVGIRVGGHGGDDGLSLGAELSEPEPDVDAPQEGRSGALAVGGGEVSVQCPPLAAVVTPVPLEVLDGLVEVVGDAVDGGGVAGSGEGDVGEFSAAAVGVDVGPVDGGSLGSVHGGGVGVIEVVLVELLASELDGFGGVVEGDSDRAGGGVDGGDGPLLAGHPPTPVVGGEGDDPVADGVVAAASEPGAVRADVAVSAPVGAGEVV
jgi:hypothetical protein